MYYQHRMGDQRFGLKGTGGNATPMSRRGGELVMFLALSFELEHTPIG